MECLKTPPGYTAHYSDTTGHQRFLETAIKEGNLTADQLTRLTLFRHFGNSDGYLILKNVNVGHVPETPLSRDNINKPDLVSEMSLLQATAMLGDPVGYRQESYGHVINNFFPHKHIARAVSSDSFDTELELHTENAFHPVQPDYLLLLCLRQDPQSEAITYITSIDNMLSMLTEDEINALRHIEYNFLSDYSSEEKNQRVDIGNRQTVLYGQRDNLLFRFDPDFMQTDDAHAMQLLDKLKQLAWRCALPLKLSYGDMLIMDNRKTAHARSQFSARFDGSDRWLQRAFAVSNKRLVSQSYQNSRGALTLPS